MSKTQKYYAVANGREIGVFKTWPECYASTNQFKGAIFKSFPTKRQAEEFISEKFPPEIPHTIVPEDPISPNKKIKLNPPHKIYFDGGSRGNGAINSVAGCGCIVKDPEGKTLMTAYKYLGSVTNNNAEYNGLLLALECAQDLGLSRIECVGDSILVVNQMIGAFAVNVPTLKVLNSQAKSMAERFKEISYKHVMRKENREADSLANKAMDEKPNEKVISK